jgi:hypothetical protein
MKTAIFEILYLILVFYITGKIFLSWLSRKITLPERNLAFFIILSAGVLSTGIAMAFSSTAVIHAFETANEYIALLQLAGTYIFLLTGVSALIFAIASYIFRLYTGETDLPALIKTGDTGKIVLWGTMIIGFALSSGIFIAQLAEYLVPYPVAPFHL